MRISIIIIIVVISMIWPASVVDALFWALSLPLSALLLVTAYLCFYLMVKAFSCFSLALSFTIIMQRLLSPIIYSICVVIVLCVACGSWFYFFGRATKEFSDFIVKQKILIKNKCVVSCWILLLFQIFPFFFYILSFVWL